MPLPLNPKKVYVLTSVKGNHGEVTGRNEAIREARRIRDELQPAFGVDVSRKEDNYVIFTAP